MMVSTSLMMGDMSESVASRSRSRTSSPCSVSLTSEMRKPEAASARTRCVASPLRSTTSMAPAALAPEGHEEVAQHQVDGDLAEERVVDGRVADGREQVDVRQPVAPREQ